VSRTARIRPIRAAAVVGALIGAVALAGCGAGQVAQTAEQVAAVGGASANVGPIAVRNAEIEFDNPTHGAAVYQPGGSAPLEMVIVNTGAEADRLIAATSPIATTVQVTGTREIPGGRALVIEGAPPAPAPTGVPGAPGATPAAPTTPATPTTAPEAGAERQASIVLTGLHEEIQAGRTYPLVLTFERAGDLRFEVPVANPATPREDEAH
jgi:copper(I)-binding protein